MKTEANIDSITSRLPASPVAEGESQMEKKTIPQRVIDYFLNSEPDPLYCIHGVFNRSVCAECEDENDEAKLPPQSEVGSMETGKADDKALCMKRCPDTGEMCKLTAGHQGRHDPMGIGESPDKWDALRRAAEAAGQYSWPETEELVMYDGYSDTFCDFIHHANPSAILELLSELRGMERGGDDAKG